MKAQVDQTFVYGDGYILVVPEGRERPDVMRLTYADTRTEVSRFNLEATERLQANLINREESKS